MKIIMNAAHHGRKHCSAEVSPWILPLFFLPLLLPLLLFAAPPKETRVSVLVDRSASFYLQASRGFKERFAPGANVAVSYIDGEPRELEAAVESLRSDPPRLVVAFGTQAAMAAASRLRGVPILYCLALNPAKNDLAGPDVGGVRLEVDLSQQLGD